MPSEKPFNAIPAGYTEHPVAPEKFAEEVQGVPPVSETFARADADCTAWLPLVDVLRNYDTSFASSSGSTKLPEASWLGLMVP